MLNLDKISSTAISQDPFDHIVVRDAFEPAFLNSVAEEVKAISPSRQFNNAQEFRKQTENSWLHLPTKTSQLLGVMNSGLFVEAIEKAFQVRQIVSDPWLLGGGVHRTFNGGYLSIHEDFSRHRILGFPRILNAIVYLNQAWEPEYGGSLELWRAESDSPIKVIEPTFNTLVVFRTDQQSLHGQPDPYSCGTGDSRDSIATYYYSTSSRVPNLKHRSTRYFVRPNSPDRGRSRIRYGVESILGLLRGRR